jgi:hypothetical protein
MFGRIVRNIKETGCTIKCKETEKSNGLMEKSMKDNL